MKQGYYIIAWLVTTSAEAIFKKQCIDCATFSLKKKKVTLIFDSHDLRAAVKAFESSPVPMKSHLIRTQYKLGSILKEYGENADEGSNLLAAAQQGKESITGRSSGTSESIELYDDLVPYWGW